MPSSPPHITAFEHQKLEITGQDSVSTLSEAEAEVLTGLGELRPGFCERGYRSVRLAQYCGVISLGHRMMEILPKVGSDGDDRRGRSVLLRLLRSAGGFGGLRISPAEQRLEPWPLLDVFIAAFLDSVAVLIRGGLLRQYHELEEDLRLVRGRIVFSRQLGVHFNRADIVASRYDELTADNAWNRSIKAALRLCRRWIMSDDLQRRWVEIYAAFEDVSDVTPTVADLDRLVYDRHAARYRESMNWARWIINLLSPAMRVGPSPAPAFLFDMNAVFERVAYHVLGRDFTAHTRRFSVRRNFGRRYLTRVAQTTSRKAFHLRPDIVITEGPVIRVIADAKWKHVDVTRSGLLRPSRADMYQMHAYASAFGVRRLALIYPANEQTRNARPTTFVLPGAAGATVSVLCIDVERDDLPVVAGRAFMGREQDTYIGAGSTDSHLG